ncbi:cell polarity protein-like protein [Venturia nashicola]|nr:cell polarity protein-like protein [Venturia nashicola]
MSFFGIGKSKKNQNSSLPAATRDISSSHGDTRSNTANGSNGSKQGAERTGTLPTAQAAAPSANASLESMRGTDISAPEPGKPLRQRAESDLGGPRSNLARTGLPLPQASQAIIQGPHPGSQGLQQPPGDSPYPWSQRRLNFTNNVSPFPRYGAAVNAMASKEGWVYMMGGLVNSQMVKGDLWMVEVGNGSMACYPVNTTSEGPGPRVGHASLLVGNAFIVFGGDTKLEDGDVLDDTLYLLNTATKQWSRASPAGPRPAGRYGHTLNILGSKIYIFGGQVEGYFFNDLVAFDLNSLQMAGNRWEVMIPNGGDGTGPVPKPRTNHSIVTWQDKLYLFGGTDGTQWFNDVWTYDPRTNAWSELDCIGYIPAPREGHAAALVNDTMYIFGGRIQDGTDLGDLAAFRISSRRWYMFQNMGMSPSPRSGHSMTAVGSHIVVLAGEPSSAPRDPTELSWSYVLDTKKIRYPPSDSMPQGALPLRKFSNDQSRIPQKSINPLVNPQNYSRGLERAIEPAPANGVMGPNQSRLPRNTGSGSGPPPQQQAPQPRGDGTGPAPGARSRTPTTGADGQVDSARVAQYDRSNMTSPVTRDRISNEQLGVNGNFSMGQSAGTSVLASAMTSRTGSIHVPSRSGSRQQRQQVSIDSSGRQTPRQSDDLQRTTSNLIDSGVGSSPALSQQNDELMKELDAAKSRNAWYASELALARKSGYQPTSSGNPLLDQQAADIFGDDDRPLIEALLRMKAELSRIQGSIDSQSESTASRIAEVEKQRDVAISEAVYAKAKLAAHGGGSQAGTPQPDSTRGVVSPDLDRANEMSKRLAVALTTQNEMSARMEHVVAELESERKARTLAEETAEAAQQRVSELDIYKQKTASELEGLRAELHEAQRLAREEAANSAQALYSSRALELDKNELSTKHARVLDDSKNHTIILQTLREAVTASSEKADLLERKLEEEKMSRSEAEQKLAQLRNEHDNRTAELETTTRQLRDTEELAEKHAAEARTHRAAVMSGFGVVNDRGLDDEPNHDERVKMLQEQLDAANAMVRKNQEAADSAGDRLRSAEERIAGLEAYQEQTTRESLGLRKQLQVAMKEVQAAHTERATMQQQLERNMLEGNALEVQLKTLKNLLEERGINAADVRRSRVLESPSSRYGTPEMNRVRELERHLDESLKAHDEQRAQFEQREQEVSREWEEKLVALDNDHQGAVKYVRGMEKMLTKLKQELSRTKSEKSELEREVSRSRSANANRGTDEAAGWHAERESLRSEMAHAQSSLKSTMTTLETQIASLKNDLSQAEKEREAIHTEASQSQAAHEAQMNQFAERARADLDALRHENELLERRAEQAETKVQSFLDQFESSVDNYRRQSRQPSQGPNGVRGHKQTNSISGDSVYSTVTDTDLEYDGESNASGQITPSAQSFLASGTGGSVSPGQSRHARDRSSMALDSLATELDSLRSQWQETNKKNYRLSDKFEFERSPSTPGNFAHGLNTPDSISGAEGSWTNSGAAPGIDGRENLAPHDGKSEGLDVSGVASNAAHTAAKSAMSS